MAATPSGVSVDITIENEETLIRVSGTRDAALIVYSESGEEVYLPPEEFEDEPEGDGPSHESHYEGKPPDQNPYEGIAPADSPYDSAGGSGRSRGGDVQGRDAGTMSVGVETTDTGFRVFHPEPVTDVRFVRG
jgi:hypothetical protein